MGGGGASSADERTHSGWLLKWLAMSCVFARGSIGAASDDLASSTLELKHEISERRCDCRASSFDSARSSRAMKPSAVTPLHIIGEMAGACADLGSASSLTGGGDADLLSPSRRISPTGTSPYSSKYVLIGSTSCNSSAVPPAPATAGGALDASAPSCLAASLLRFWAIGDSGATRAAEREVRHVDAAERPGADHAVRAVAGWLHALAGENERLLRAEAVRRAARPDDEG
jgi:hypothetical protein